MENMNPPKPNLKQRKWPYLLIWILPVLVLIMTGFYIKEYFVLRGPEIAIKFSDAAGLVEGQTRLLYRGAVVGRVTTIALSEDRKRAVVHVRLHKDQDIFGTKGATFWIVRPEISGAGFSGMETVMTGSYIHAIPGKGEEDVEEFDGLNKEPLPYEEGERFTLVTTRLGHVQVASSVYYKGITVGRVDEIELAKDASHVDIRILVWTRYAHLVRENSKFWIDNGFDVKGGIFSGFRMKLDSLQALAAGGVDFATPEKEMRGTAKPGTIFQVEEDSKKEWEQWSPRITVSPRNSDANEQKKDVPTPVTH